MDKKVLAGKTALFPSMLSRAVQMSRPSTLWALQWSKPDQSLQNLKQYSNYASSMGRFFKSDNTIPNATNPESWNLYSFVNGNPVNFNDPTGHQGETTQQKVVDPNYIPQTGEKTANEEAKQKEETKKPPQGVNDQAKIEQVAGTIYNEVGSLRAQDTVQTDKSKKPTKDPKSEEELQKARVAIGKVVLNIEAAKKKISVASSSVSAEGKKTTQYKKALEAAKTAIEGGGDPKGPKHYYIYCEEAKDKVPKWAQGTPAESYGPFVNPVKVGDVPVSTQVYVQIFDVP